MYTYRKYEGDDLYSYAVFRKKDLLRIPKGSVIFYGMAIPIQSGLSLNEARSLVKQLNIRENNGIKICDNNWSR